MLFTEFICQFSHQFTDLQNTECGCIAVNGVVPKCLGVVAESVNGLLNLLAVDNDVFQSTDVAVKRLHTAAPHLYV